MDFSQAIELDPELWQAYFNRGTANYKLDEYADAVADLSMVVEINPEVVDTYYWRGFSYIGLEEFENAITDFELLLELDPEYPQKDEVESILAQFE